MLTSVSQRDALERERHGQGRAQRTGERDRPVVVGIVEQDRELVAAQPGQQVTGVQLLGQAGPDLDQQPVPGVVAEAVVDLLEPVQVQHQQGTSLALGQRQAGRDVGVERAPVGQPGQRVGTGLATQVGHRDELPERQLGAGRRGEQRHGREHDREPGHLPSAWPAPGRPGPPRSPARGSIRAMLRRAGRTTVGPGGHRPTTHRATSASPDSPAGIERRAELVGAVGDQQGEGHVGRGEDQQTEDEEQPAAPGSRPGVAAIPTTVATSRRSSSGMATDTTLAADGGPAARRPGSG